MEGKKRACEDTAETPSPKRKEMISGITHLVATLLSVAGLVLLVVLAVIRGSAIHVVAFSIFGASLILLYLSSALYHFISSEHRAKRLFQKIDHSMIYVLIAGTYTPIALIVLPPAWGWSIFGVIWGFAIVGLLVTFSRLAIKKWLPTTLYLLMGWLIVVAFWPLQAALPHQGLFLLILGGVLYTLGTIFFVLDTRKHLSRYFSFHDIFHLFVMAGSISHFFLMLKYVLPAS